LRLSRLVALALIAAPLATPALANNMPSSPSTPTTSARASQLPSLPAGMVPAGIPTFPGVGPIDPHNSARIIDGATTIVDGADNLGWCAQQCVSYAAPPAGRLIGIARGFGEGLGRGYAESGGNPVTAVGRSFQRGAAAILVSKFPRVDGAAGVVVRGAVNPRAINALDGTFTDGR
jgi:hypothetical protein